MIKKIAIMTWFKDINYGSLLQALSLSYKIDEFGYESYLIDYTSRINIKEYSKFKNYYYIKEKYRAKLFNVFHRPYQSEDKKVLFTKVISKFLRVTNPKNTYAEFTSMNQDFNAFVCGSDQIWAPSCFDEMFYLPFVKNTKKMIAYAPSIGMSEIMDDYIARKMRHLINRFNHLSVREETGAKIIRELCNKSAKVVLDPTLLLTKQEWILLIKDNVNLPNIKNRDYIICYFLGDSKDYLKDVSYIAKKLKLSVYIIPVLEKQKKKKHVLDLPIGPFEFLDLFLNAKYVCTDSFHGTAFAINFNIPFTTYQRFKEQDKNNQNSRIYNLLKITHLEDRLKLCNDQKCYFEEANNLLAIERKKSIAFLKEALKVATQNIDIPKNIKITDLCCGCGACSTVCPADAIQIKLDGNGFEKYVINESKCIQCKSCIKVCPFNTIDAKNLSRGKSLFAYKSLSPDSIYGSSSGGASNEFAKLMIKDDYWICGCVYNNKRNRAEHRIISPNNKSALSLIQGSKYIQSSVSKVMKEIVINKSNKKYLFIGTPCQVAGMDHALKKYNNRQNVLLIDLICHGVPSILLWDKYLNYINTEH